MDDWPRKKQDAQLQNTGILFTPLTMKWLIIACKICAVYAMALQMIHRYLAHFNYQK